MLTFYLAFYLTFSPASGWGPAVPTELWTSRLKPVSAHWALELAANVRQCPLRSGARSWGPEEGGGQDAPLIKSTDPHLASGEKKVGWDPSPPSLALWWSPPGTKWLQWALPRRSPSLCWAKSCVCRAAAGASPEFPRLGRGNRLKKMDTFIVKQVQQIDQGTARILNWGSPKIEQTMTQPCSSQVSWKFDPHVSPHDTRSHFGLTGSMPADTDREGDDSLMSGWFDAIHVSKWGQTRTRSRTKSAATS